MQETSKSSSRVSRSYRGHRSVRLLVAALLFSGCGGTSKKPDKPVTAEVDTLEILENSRSARMRLEGEFSVGLPGIFGAVGGVNALAFVQSPSLLRIELTSFFAQPLQIIASDGKDITVFDGISPGGPRFLEAEASRKSLDRLLPISLSPEDIVHVCLGAMLPFDKVEDSSRNGETIHIETSRVDGTRIHTTAKFGSDEISEHKICSGPDVCPVVVHMDDWHAGEGESEVALPHEIKIRVTTDGETTEVTLSAKKLRLNGSAFPPELFRVRLPSGKAFKRL